MNIEKLLFATDFSDCAAMALSVAGSLAKRIGAELHIVNVFSPLAHAGLTAHTYPLFAEYEGLVTELARRQLAALDTPSGVKVEPEIVFSPSVAGGIMSHATSIRADILAVGSRGHGRLAGLFLGSIPEQLVRLAACPVLVVPTHDGTSAAALSAEVVIAPWDLSGPGASALPAAAELARLLSARLLLVHVADPQALPALRMTTPNPVLQTFPSFGALAKNRMHAWVVENAGDLETEVLILEGRPHLLVAELARERAAGLVVVSPLGFGAGPRKLLGSTVGKVLRVSPCSVLVVR